MFMAISAKLYSFVFAPKAMNISQVHPGLVELIQGITHATEITTLVSVTQNGKTHSRTQRNSR
jgi:hypothetical protein